MRITQGTFSYLPDFTDAEILAQIQYAIDQGWAVAVEFTDDPHPRNVLWEMWGLPMFEIADAAGGDARGRRLPAAYPDHYVRVTAYDASLGPADHGAQLHRQPSVRRAGVPAGPPGDVGPALSYSLHAYAADRPRGERYAELGAGPGQSA